MRIGYGRTSTAEQIAGLEAQERDLAAAGCDKTFVEQLSSVAKRRPQLEAAIDFAREGDDSSSRGSIGSLDPLRICSTLSSG